MVSFVMLILYIIFILGVNWAQRLSIVVGMDINRMFRMYGYNTKSIALLLDMSVIMCAMTYVTYHKNIKLHFT